jgi:hypothetical protein
MFEFEGRGDGDSVPALGAPLDEGGAGNSRRTASDAAAAGVRAMCPKTDTDCTRS